MSGPQQPNHQCNCTLTNIMKKVGINANPINVEMITYKSLCGKSNTWYHKYNALKRDIVRDALE